MGLKTGSDPGPRFDENTYAYRVEELQNRGIGVLPANLNEALDELEADQVLGQALGSDYLKLYLQVKRREWDEYHNTVSDWEVERYLTVG